ncbi:MAG: transporter substrate-binding domain-containing protein [Lachnospiraceae bacterium]|nr:transporter substrate-binding domain-containing protein [Lachnospiraceae bacterium]
MKNLKTVLSTMFLAMLSLLIVACSNSASNTTTESTVATENKETIAQKKTFTVGFDAEYPPYGFVDDDGTYKGFDLDLAKEFCSRAGYEFKPQPIDWDSKDLELNQGNIDCIWNGFTVTGRENDYTWTFPYVDNSIVLVVRSDSGITKKADLAGKIVMGQAGSSAITALEEEENAELVKSFKSLEQCADYNSGFMNLESGMIDCLAVDIGVAKFHLNNANGKYVQLDEKLSSEQYAIGFKKGNTALRDEVEKVVTEMWKDGTFMNIANNYSDYSLSDMVCLGDYIK